MIGQTLLQYEFLELLGEGGMGQVYKARDTRLRRLVALKVLSPDRPVTEDRRRRFLREARAASALNHPGIVTVHDIARADEVDFIVMEYVDGYSLAEKISQGSMAWRDAASIALEIGEAMVVAHDAGLVHRDLKPLNVMINSDGRVKVLDFGIAKLDPTVASDITETLTRPETEIGGSPGTLAYMSPEQFLGETLDARSDIFSFGVVLFEMLTGQRPFDGQPQVEDGQHTFLYRLLYGEAPGIRDTHPEVPELLAGLVARCLERQRIDRPQTMIEVVQDLRQVLGTDPGRVLPPPIPIVGAENIPAVNAEGVDETLPVPPPPLPTARQRGPRRSFLRSAARVTARLIFALVFSGVVFWGLQSWQRRAQLNRIVHGEPAAALQALDKRSTHPEADPEDLLALLRQRATPTDVLNHTPDGLSGDDAVRWWLRFSEIVLPWIEETPEDSVLVASLMHRIDFLDARDPQLLAQAYDLRGRVIEILRRQRPPPTLGGPDWFEVPAGDLEEVWVPAFRLLRRPVTAGEYRLLRPSHSQTPEHLPATAVDWYQAYSYAAWLGGRLPTEDELRYAADTCSPYGSCQPSGWQSSWSLDDMLGNTVEWVAGKSGPDPTLISAARGSVRAEELATGGQSTGMPAPATAGFRVVLPRPSLPPAVTLTAPESGATLPSGANVRISADAFDLDGTILKVRFSVYNRGRHQSVGEDTTEPYETLWKDVADGYYVVHAEAIDDDGRKASDKAQVRIGVPRLPYHEESVTIPGKIEAEDFDLGANGAAYFDNSPGNTGRAYRTDTDVDIQTTQDVGGGFNVGWSGAGEWLEYTVEVTASGDYDLHARVACDETGGAFHVEFDGVDKTGLMTVPETGGWQRWETIVRTVQLDAGVQVMRWRNAPSSVEFNLNYFMIVAAGSSVCGDGVCQAGEDCSSCSSDCPSVTEGWPVERHCCGNGVTEPPEEDGSICGGNN